MNLKELIERKTRERNAAALAYNELGSELDKLREATEIDAAREAELVEQRASKSALVKELDAAIERYEAEARSDAEISLRSEQVVEAPVQRAQVTEKANPVYRKDDPEVSYFRDLYNARHMGDEKARQRLIASQETRAATTTAANGGSFAPPLWLVDDFVALARAGRVTADRMNIETLPEGVSSINIPKLTGGADVAVVQTQNTTITESTVTSTSVSSGITEIAGKQTVSIALLRQSGTPIDRIILGDLAAAYAATLDGQVIAGSNANGQLRGLITAGTTVTYTSTQPSVVSTTAADSFYGKVLSASAAMFSSRYAGPDTIVMHPRRWNWVLNALDSSLRPLVVPGGPAFNQVAIGSGAVGEGYAGELLGLPVYVDPNIPTNIGTSTNQDVVFVLRTADLWLWESQIETASFDATLAAQNSVLFRALGFSAFIPHRHAASVQVISGTGLVAPTF